MTFVAYDVRTGETVKSKVTSTVHLKCDHLRYLTVRDDHGTEQTFQTTDTHPFWVNSDRPDQYRKARDSVSEHDVSTNSDVQFEHDNLFVTENGYYVEAKDLKIGDIFIGPNGEASVLVDTRREAHPEGIDVYNFKVADNSNYFVIANYADFQNGAEPVLVHNAKCTQQAAGNMRSLGLEGIALSHKSYNSERKILERAGFKMTRVTETGRKVFTNTQRKGVEIYYDSRKALVNRQKNHWHIKDENNYYTRFGDIVDKGEGRAHITGH